MSVQNVRALESEIGPLDGYEMALALESAIPYDENGRPIVQLATCGACFRRWNDAAISARTPAPSARCPFEADHNQEEQ
jgi:hypothetical protein